MDKFIVKESEVREVLEMLVREYLMENSDYVNENGEMDWDGDGSNVGISRSELVMDFKEWIR